MARSLNGSTDLINFGNNIAPTAITISEWIYPTSFTPAYAATICRDSGSVFWQILVKSTGKLAYYLSAVGGTIGLDPGSTTLSTGTWYHVCITYDSVGGLKAFINAASDGTAAANGILQTAFGATPLEFGNDTANAGRNFAGRGANIGIWGVSLTAGEISALSQGAIPYTIRPGSLLGYWPLDGIQSPEPDLSGNAFNGTLTGTALAPGPPVMQFTPRWPLNSPFKVAAASTFQAAWALNRNRIFDGVAT